MAAGLIFGPVKNVRVATFNELKIEEAMVAVLCSNVMEGSWCMVEGRGSLYAM